MRKELNMARKVIVVNGPNLGRLGVRAPDVYGHQDLETLRRDCTAWGEELGLEVEVRQTDNEAEMIGWMHRDKKARGNMLRFVVLDRVGHVIHLENPPMEAVEEAFRRIRP